MKLSSKTIAGIVSGVAVVAFGGTATFMGLSTTQPNTAMAAAPSVVSSTSASSQMEVSSLVKNTSNMQVTSSVSSQATSKVVQQATSQPTLSGAVSKAHQIVKYMVINPQTGTLIQTGDPNYEKFKSELGGDAGTVPPDKSNAVQAALAKIQAANAAQTSSTASK